MHRTWMKNRCVPVLIAALLAGCGGGVHSAMLPAAPQQQPGSAPFTPQARGGASLSVTITIPKRRKQRGMHSDYISVSTQSIGFAYTTLATKTSHPEQYANVTPTSKGCTAGSSGTTCTLSFSALPGKIAYRVDAFSGVHGRGKRLATAQARMAVAANTANSFSITLDGVPASFQLNFAVAGGHDESQLPVGVAADASLEIAAYDAGGNLIVNSPAFASPAGTKLTSATLHVAGNPDEFSVKQNGHTLTPVSASTYRITAPFTGVAVRYGGGLYANVAITLAAGKATGQTVLHVEPVVTQYTVSGVDGSVDTIAAGPDGNMWFTENNSATVGKITPQGVATTYTLPSYADHPSSIIAGSDGNLWFAEGYYPTNPGIGRITTSGSIAIFGAGMFEGCQTYPGPIVSGPNGDVWFADSSCSDVGYLDPKNPTGAWANYGGVNGSTSIASGADGNIWVANTGDPTACIGSVTPTGTYTSAGCYGNGSPRPRYFAATSDGNIWYAQDNAIARYSPSAKTFKGIYPPNVSSIFSITTGPDKLLWYGGVDGSGNALLGYARSNGSTVSVPLYGGAQFWPEALAEGPSGTLWCFGNSNTIVKIDLGG